MAKGDRYVMLSRVRRLQRALLLELPELGRPSGAVAHVRWLRGQANLLRSQGEVTAANAYGERAEALQALLDNDDLAEV